MFRVALVLTLALVASDWNVAVPDYAWEFPRDHWKHDGYRTEWWYLTGHLEAGERRFGYQFTFFRIGIVDTPVELDSDWASTSVIMGHAAVTDIDAGTHVFSEVLYREMPLLASFGEYPDTRIGWSRAPAGTDAEWTLDWNGDGFDVSARDDERRMAFRLSTRARKPLVFQGPNGFSPKSADGEEASQYYSFTRMHTEGELELAGESFRVRGESWMDKEFSSSHLSGDQVGWDWFSLQLDDDRELMLYLMRAPDGAIDFASGTLVSAGGEATYLSGSDFEVEPLDFWSSEATGARYPSAWHVRLPAADLSLEIRSLVPDQENRSRLPGGVFYWEGAVGVSGTQSGRGFVELSGYGEGNRPPV